MECKHVFYVNEIGFEYKINPAMDHLQQHHSVFRLQKKILDGQTLVRVEVNRKG